MQTESQTNNYTYQVVEECYRTYRDKVRTYIVIKLGDADLAEDLTQDVFLRLLECGQTIRPETARNMVYTISRNIVIDYIRRHYLRQDMEEYFMKNAAVASNDQESSFTAHDIAMCEHECVKRLPAQRQKVYELARYEDMSATAVAAQLNLSIRTVENHLYISRKQVREHVLRCIG